MRYTTDQEIAHLVRARAALDNLIAAKQRGKADEADWLAFYDAASFIPGIEDAATEQADECRRELRLGDDGWPLDDAGYPMPDNGWGFHHHRMIAPLAAIPAQGVVA